MPKKLCQFSQGIIKIRKTNIYLLHYFKVFSLLTMLLAVTAANGVILAQVSIVDSLVANLENLKEDSTKVKLLNEIAGKLYRSDPQRAIEYANEAQALAERIKYKKGSALAFRYIGSSNYNQGYFVEAAINWERALEINKALNDDRSIANNLSNLGAIYAQFGDETKSIEYFLQALQIAERVGDSLRIATCLLNIGAIYSVQASDQDDAIEYYLKALNIAEAIIYKVAVGMCLFNIGESYLEMENYDSALFYFDKSITSFESNIDIVASLNSIGKTLAKMGDFDAAIDYHKRALLLAEEDNLQLEEAQILIGLANAFRELGNLNSAIEYFKRAESIAKDIGVDYELKDAYRGLANSYSQLSQFQEAFDYLLKANSLERTIYDQETNDKINNLLYSYELDKKDAEIQILEQRSEIEKLRDRRQKIIILSTGIVGILLLLLVVFIYNRLQFTRKTKAKIKEQRDEIETQIDEIEAQRDEIEAQRDELEIQRDTVVNQKNEILDSITYAEKIQAAMLPPEQYFQEILNDVFILFKPRDIVSGDFYWIKQVNKYVILAAADCTGHGVPGAFMSMLGISYLNEIVQRREITQANQVLSELRKQIRNSLRQHGQPEESKDGIDMALCVIDEKNRVLQYAGANNPLYLIRDNNGIPELTEFKADRMPLGYYQGKFKSFTNNDIQLEFGDVIYLFSDGFIDQKGGEKDKKFMSKSFKKLLLEIHDEPMEDQKQILDKTIVDWMGDNPQIDDILVIGIRV
jgi:serine phosphatase RsbU (regulator of sigma subunit)/Tfp pilus assembly protein PilF